MERNTGGLPKWYVERPPAYAGDEFFLRAFWELSSTRQYGQAIGPIPWHRIVQYGSHHGLSACMIRVLEIVIRELDEAWLLWQRETQRRKTETTRGKTKSKK